MLMGKLPSTTDRWKHVEGKLCRNQVPIYGYYMGILEETKYH